MRCVYPELTEPDGRCPMSARSRGACHNHYQTAQAMLRDGRAREADLVARGLYMPKGEGSSPTKGNAAYKFGSQALGFAPAGIKKAKARAARAVARDEAARLRGEKRRKATDPASHTGREFGGRRNPGTKS